jgi:hypothetical protein
MIDSTLVFSKEGLDIIKNNKNNYSLLFSIENNNIYLPKIIHFNTINLLCELYSDLIEKYDLQINENKNEAIIYILFKHLFEDLGLPHYYIYIHITQNITDKITFVFKSIKLNDISLEIEPINITTGKVICSIITSHKISVEWNILIGNIDIPECVEKILGLIIYKLFNRIKQFIENINI